VSVLYDRIAQIRAEQAGVSVQDFKDREDDFAKVVKLVLPFGIKVKNKLLELKKTAARFECPDTERHEAEIKYVTAHLMGKKNHLHMACEDPQCCVRMME